MLSCVIFLDQLFKIPGFTDVERVGSRGSHLHQGDEVLEELVGVLLPAGRELRVALADQRLEHLGGEALLLVLETESNHCHAPAP